MYRIMMCVAVGAFFTSTAFADETLKYRSVYHITAAQAQDVGDVDGHTMSLVRAFGLASFSDGSVATDYFVSTTDYVKGSGPFLNYGGLAFNDGSVLWYKTNGAVVAEGTKTSNKGTITIFGGKGRFEGAKGDGTITGGRLQVQLGSGAELYSDVTLNIKK
jgi:hypothetical protein